MPDLPRRIVISATSDIGCALAADWLAAECEVHGTYRTPGRTVDELADSGASLWPCDLADAASIERAVEELRHRSPNWDVLVLAAGTIEPIGPFLECDFDRWSASLEVNFTGQMRLLHELLPARRRTGKLPPLTLLFAGGGTNNATVNYSAYTLAKIALIKAAELLAAEICDCRFSVVGPGWVNTKIHQATLMAGERAGDAYRRTREKLASNDWVPIQRVVDCCNWLVYAPGDVINGRNFSTAHDPWGEPRLDELLRRDPDMYKLRRAGNGRLAA
ncbi:MAG TPA: SDR family oxidoreductase [Pirellulales bacterium]|jgi:NAD(P)-dependent dehydrogenase (short-subunit alcohol dehydrogenase family)|nr:SDR family oxidoreductase [Pirellulales bacterium]